MWGNFLKKINAVQDRFTELSGCGWEILPGVSEDFFKVC
jgi:hypothetical protein